MPQAQQGSQGGGASRGKEQHTRGRAEPGEQGSDVCGACGGGGPKLICKNSGREGFGDSGVDNSFKGLCLEGNRNGADTGERSGANTA